MVDRKHIKLGRTLGGDNVITVDRNGKIMSTSYKIRQGAGGRYRVLGIHN